MRSLRILLASKTDNNVVSEDSQIGYRSAEAPDCEPYACFVQRKSRSQRGCGPATRSRAFGTLVDAPRPHSRARIRRSGGTAECMSSALLEGSALRCRGSLGRNPARAQRPRAQPDLPRSGRGLKGSRESSFPARRIQNDRDIGSRFAPADKGRGGAVLSGLASDFRSASRFGSSSRSDWLSLLV